MKIISRTRKAQIARETLDILREGKYTAAGKEIDISKELENSVNRTKLFTPSKVAELAAQIKQNLRESQGPEKEDSYQKLEVDPVSTLAAAKKFKEQGYQQVTALNFASGTNPGGGFLEGSTAQEESLARKTGLYLTLTEQGQRYYAENRRRGSALYTDHLIYSPQVPVIRNTNDELIEDPWTVNIVTAPAVNAGRLKNEEPEKLDQIKPTMKRRLDYILAVAAKYDTEALVLGAFGCGAFKNSPEMMAELFAGYLQPGGVYSKAFAAVNFAVLSRSGESRNYKVFLDRLS